MTRPAATETARRRSRMSWRVALAVGAGRVAGALSRLAGRGGTALPGLVAERLAPFALAHLAQQMPRGVVIVTGTNGKTTTSHLVRDIITHAGVPVIHNATGSNLSRGLLATLMAHAGVFGDLHAPDGSIAVLETDEATVSRALEMTNARVLVVTNLFRDQLDRYGEVDAVRDRWTAALEATPAWRRPTLVLNVDDPAVASLAASAGPAGVVPFGILDQAIGQAEPDHAADAKQCPVCSAGLAYDRVTYGHLGAWRCPTGHARPQLQVAAHHVEPTSTGARFDLVVDSDSERLELALPGLYNTYNAVAAAATARALGIEVGTSARAIAQFRGAFGRFERVTIDGRTVVLVLAKNPVGMNEVLRAVIGDPTSAVRLDLLLALNDLDADGRDVSWIWDSDFEMLSGCIRHVTVSGRRATDLAMRLAYAGVGAPAEANVAHEVVENLEDALDRALGRVQLGGTLTAVVTYTAMLDLRRVLVQRGYASPYWDNPAAAGRAGMLADRPLDTPPDWDNPTSAGRAGMPADRLRQPTPGPDDMTAGPRTTSDVLDVHMPADASNHDGIDHAEAPVTVAASAVVRAHAVRLGARARRVRVGHLYPDLLNLYADRGNVIALRRRCEWRGIDFELVPIGIGDEIVPGTVDLAFMGGGQDGDQAFLADDLFRIKADGLRGLVTDGVPLLAVCGSYQLLGHYYDPASGPRLAGLGIFDLHTAHPGVKATRCIGNIVVEWLQAPDHAPHTLVGFENHGGRTWLGTGATPFARVVSGSGNNGTDRTEGIVVGNAIGTYIHGSLLPKNPHLTDRLIALALDPTGTTALEPLDDAVEWRAHRTVLHRFAPALATSDARNATGATLRP